MQFPIDPYLDAIRDTLNDESVVLLKAEPGAGKTTRVPQHLMGGSKRVLVVEPRRLAARLAAEWVAAQCQVKLGEEVGYQIRLDSKKSAKTRLLYVTEGVLTRLFIQDPLLKNFDVIVLDEFHERHIHTDIALALVRALQKKRSDLKLVIMSATLDLGRLESYLGSVKRFDIPGRVFPVTVSYHPSSLPLPQHVAQAAKAMLQETEGNILVFLSGIGQISACERALEGVSAQVIPLTADLAGNYSKIVENPSRRKIILATNVAETSLTLPAVRGVIDAGTARILGYAPWSGLPTLEDKKVSQASCIQRTGRAGRVAEGICYRLFSEADFHARARFTEPEIQRIDLCQILLEIQGIFPAIPRAWESLEWLEAPKAAIVEQNQKLLEDLGAIDSEGGLTEEGQEMAGLPLHPRLSRIVLSGEAEGMTAEALLAALIINEGMLVRDDSLPEEHADCDVCQQLGLFLKQQKKMPLSRPIDMGKAFRIKGTYDSLRRAWELPAIDAISSIDEMRIRHAIFSAFADRVAKYRPMADQQKRKIRHYNFCMGRGGTLNESSAVQAFEWIVAIEAREAYGETQGRIFAAAGIDPAWLSDDPFHLMEEAESETIDPKTGKAKLLKQTLYGKLLVEESWDSLDDEQASGLLQTNIRRIWPKPFDDVEVLDVYHRKLDLLDTYKIEHKMPRFEGEMLDLLIDYLCEGASSLKDVARKDLQEAINDQLDYDDLELLRRSFPESITLPRGRKLKIHYAGEAEPWIASRLQDFLGLLDTPRVCRDLHPLVVKLLAPSQRPAQITRDLRSFWQGSSQDVKKDLKRRYPKHLWPEDPINFDPKALDDDRKKREK